LTTLGIDKINGYFHPWSEKILGNHMADFSGLGTGTKKSNARWRKKRRK
jgi:hypothetical protein